MEQAATEIAIPSDQLWQAMCAEWVATVMTKTEGEKIVQEVHEALDARRRRSPTRARERAGRTKTEAKAATERPKADDDAKSGQRRLFD